jgi:hypothetical protein
MPKPILAWAQVPQQVIISLAGLEITADHQSMIGKKLLMISRKAGFPT